MDYRKIFVVVMAIMLGLFISMQSKSLDDYSELLIRDNTSNVFQEIGILKEKNESLEDEIASLEANLELLDNQNLALVAIEEEIGKYMRLSGDSPIFGKGFELKLEGKLDTPWLVDLINEMMNSGAQAIAINGVRYNNDTAGFDTLPQGQILYAGNILQSPFEFVVIGDAQSVVGFLEAPGGIIERMKGTYPGLRINFEEKDVLKI